MTESPTWLRAVWWKPRLRRSVQVTFVLAIAGAASVATLALTPERTALVPISVPVPITVAAPRPSVTVSPPAVSVTVAPPPQPSQAPVFRRRTPIVDVDCMMPGQVSGDACSWDDGFPAISADGRLIALRTSVSPPSGVAVTTGIELIDSATSKVVRRDDVVTYGDDHRLPPATEARARARAAAVQRFLDERQFRTLSALGSSRVEEVGPGDPREVHAEYEGTAMRIVDPATARVLWQGRWTVTRPKPAAAESDCASWDFHGVTAWWDPSSRTVLAQLAYLTGGCTCPTEYFLQVRRTP
jgi:hypothetical protein